jgi:hypothetical protein
LLWTFALHSRIFQSACETLLQILELHALQSKKTAWDSLGKRDFFTSKVVPSGLQGSVYKADLR